MVKIRMAQCKHEGCTSIAEFNEPNKKVARFCAEHTLEGMVHVSIARSRDNCAPSCRSTRLRIPHEFEGVVNASGGRKRRVKSKKIKKKVKELKQDSICNMGASCEDVTP